MTLRGASIIVSFYKNETYLKECVEHCLRLDYPEFEVIVVSNSQIVFDSPKVRTILVEGESQGEKKDAGVAAALGELCAFIDDDAYPSPDWLKNAARYFEDNQVGAVCGPGLTPPRETFLQEASGAVYSSLVGSGPLRFRYVPRRLRDVKEAPGYNLIIRRSLLRAIGGISTSMRSGEDTMLSLKVVRANMRILYAPDVIVYHHRRSFFRPHLRQVMNYGTHRGYLSRATTEVKTESIYFLPLLAVTIVMAITSYLMLNGAGLAVGIAVAFVTGAYLISCFASALAATRNVGISIFAVIGIPLTHLAYAIGFFRGLVLVREIGERPSH